MLTAAGPRQRLLQQQQQQQQPQAQPAELLPPSPAAPPASAATEQPASLPAMSPPPPPPLPLASNHLPGSEYHPTPRPHQLAGPPPAEASPLPQVPLLPRLPPRWRRRLGAGAVCEACAQCKLDAVILSGG